LLGRSDIDPQEGRQVGRGAIPVYLGDRLQVPFSWLGVIRRTSQLTLQDNCLGLAAELAYYYFLALFPALLFFVALASFFPIDWFTDHVLSALDRFAPPDVLSLIRDQFL
jgi:uncharacterized BrkB/YihY/UPF0761 family membrane protein